MKYLMEKKFIPYWNIALTLGLTLTTFATLLLFVALIDKDKSASNIQVIYSFYKSFQEGIIGLIILKQFTLIVLNFFLITFSLLTSFYFDPSFVLISYEFSKFFQVLKDNPEKAYVIVFFILQFFCLLIVLEIIELNFCGLNKNTKRNISQRGMSELLEENGADDSSVGLNQLDINKDYYIINTAENQKNEDIELNQQSSSENISES